MTEEPERFRLVCKGAFNNGASLQRIGKKQRAAAAATSAAIGTPWEDLLAFPRGHDEDRSNGTLTT